MSRLASDQNYNNLVVKQTLVVQGTLSVLHADIGYLYTSKTSSLADLTCTSLTISGDHSAENVHASATINFGDQILGADGVAGHPAFAFTSDATTGLYKQGTDEIGVSLGGVNYWSVGTQAIQSAAPISGFMSAENASSTATPTLTVAQVLAGSYQQNGGSTSISLPAAATLVAGLTNPVPIVGTTLSLFITAAANNQTLVCATGGSFVGGSTVTITAKYSAYVTLRFSNVTSGTEAYHVYLSGAGVTQA